MRQSIKVAPPNSLFFVADSDGGKTPDINPGPGNTRLWSTRSCIAIGCLSFCDGETELTLSTVASDAPASSPVFDGVIDTPKKNVMVSTSEWEILLKAEVPSHFTRVRVWTDHPSEPENIMVVLGEVIQFTNRFE